jgi:two-component system, chemotaxis family, chemotaxis protein CheY
MKTLIVEDDPTSGLLLQALLRDLGPSQLARNGLEAVEAARSARDAGEPYDLICMDIMMPGMDGHEALEWIRGHEESRGVTSTRGTKIMMTTALDDMKNLGAAYRNLCDAYLVKPILKVQLYDELRKLGLIP